MKEQTKKGQGSGMELPQGNQAPSIQNKLTALAELNKKNKIRTAFQTHLEMLQASEVQNPDEEHTEGSNVMQKIILKFGYNETYDITSPTLLTEIKAYLIDRISVRISEVEHEIVNIKI